MGVAFNHNKWWNGQYNHFRYISYLWIWLLVHSNSRLMSKPPDPVDYLRNRLARHASTAMNSLPDNWIWPWSPVLLQNIWIWNLEIRWSTLPKRIFDRHYDTKLNTVTITDSVYHHFTLQGFHFRFIFLGSELNLSSKSLFLLQVAYVFLQRIS